MSLRFGRRPEIAPLRLRVFAGAIDVGAALAVTGLLAAGVFAGLRGTGRQAGAVQRIGTWLADPGLGRSPGASFRRHVWLADLASRLVLRGRGTLGQRIAGVRVVEVDTGAAPGVRAVLVLWGARAILGKGLSLGGRGSLRRGKPQRDAAAARLTALRERGETDPQALAEAATGIRTGCLGALAYSAATSATRALVIVRSARHQSIEQWLAGLMVVRRR